MRCPNCGADLPDTAHMCYSCRIVFDDVSDSEGKTGELKGPGPQMMGPDPTIFERHIPSKQEIMKQNRTTPSKMSGRQISPSFYKYALIALLVIALLVYYISNKSPKEEKSDSSSSSVSTDQNPNAGTDVNGRLAELSKYDTVSGSNYESVKVDDVVASKDGVSVLFSGEIVETSDEHYSDFTDYYDNRDFYDQTFNVVTIKAYVKDSAGSQTDVCCSLVNLKKKADFKEGDKVTIAGETDGGGITKGYVLETQNTDFQYTQEEFESKCSKLSYDELLTYPDTHKGEKVKIKVKVEKVQEAGFVSNYCYYGKINGKYIIIHDIRLNEEPRIQEGNTITVYGYADGLITLKEKEVDYYFGVIDKTVDKYEVPDIDLVYVEK